VGVLLDVLEAVFGLLAHEPSILTLALAAAAAAQSEPFEMTGTNADGVLSQEEISAFFGADLVSRILDAEDANGDGILIRAEAEHALAKGADWRDYEGPDAGEDRGERECATACRGRRLVQARAVPLLKREDRQSHVCKYRQVDAN
jgi:hypothetical protein